MLSSGICRFPISGFPFSQIPVKRPVEYRGAVEPRPSDPRALAWDILRRVEEHGGYADALLGRQRGGTGLSARDQALATQLVYGTLAWQGYLDHLIAAFSRRPPDQLDAPVRILLRLALFQICRLTRVPPFAAVDTAVQLAKGFRGGAAAGLVNAVLRRAAREWQQVRFPAREADAGRHLAIRLSHPRWLVEEWLQRYGFDETDALLAANNEPAPTVLRVNRRKIEPAHLLARLGDAGYTARATRYSPVGIVIESGGAPEIIPGYADGLFSVQGEASQLVSFLVAPPPGDGVLDLCAAPGGKATHLAELMDDRGKILALDVNLRGIRRLQRTARRLGLTIVQPAVADVVSLHEVPRSRLGTGGEGFASVLLDAPCSGLGTLRQHPEVKWRRTPEDVARLAAVQQALLRVAAAHVRPGGVLVYATCTLTAAENDEQIAAFLSAQPAFAIDDARPLLPPSSHTLVGGDGILRTFPHRHGLDGFFAARLKRRG
jgi:16S rRNA (cytosine967-C5)-methyltransferase